MNAEEITNKVKDIVFHHLFDVTKDKVESINVNASLETMGADSLDKLEILMTVEEEFDCGIPDHIAQGFSTIADIAKHLHAKEQK